jgi:hypothetical protein
MNVPFNNQYGMSILNKKFNMLIVFYWTVIYFSQKNMLDEKLLYLVFVLPISIFIMYSLFYIKRKTLPLEAIWILLFVMINACFCIIRFDINGLLSGSLFGLAIVMIHYFKLNVNLKILNYLFLVSAVLSIPFYYFGLSIYGFLPGQSSTSNLEALAGRVSLFWDVSLSIYFSFFIFIINLFYNKSKTRFFYLCLSFYFFYFGISRTALLALIIVFIIYYSSRKYHLNNIFYKVILPLLLILIPVIILIEIEPILRNLLNMHFSLIQDYFFRGFDDSESILKDLTRLNIWSEHFRIFIDHPLGINTNEMSKYMNFEADSGGSESFLTRIFVVYGISAIFIYFYLFTLLYKSIKYDNAFMYLFVFLFIFIGFTYGSFFNVYNILFLIFISSINIKVSFENSNVQ